MDDVVRRLLVILDAEEALYARMRDLLQREREVVLCMDLAGLEETARQKEELADEARLLEESRVDVASALAESLSLPPRTPLAQLCRQLGDVGRPLRTVHNRLVILVSVVRELVDANAALVGESLSEIRSTLHMLGGFLPEDNLYGSATGATPGLTSGRLLRRSA